MNVHGWPLFSYKALGFYMTPAFFMALAFFYPHMISISHYKRQSLAR